MTSEVFSEKLRDHGVHLSADRVRALWRKGMSHTSPATFAKQHAKKAGARGDPDIKAARLKLVLEQTELTRIRKEAEEIELGQARGELWRKSEVLAAYKSTLAKVRAQLDAKLRVDLPARCAGQPAEVIEAAIGEALDAAYAAISKP